MEIERYLGALRRSWISVVLIAVVCGLGAYMMASMQAPQYRASGAVLFEVQGAENADALLKGSSFARSQVRSYAELARKDVVLAPVVAELGLDRTPASLAGSIKVNVPLDTAIVEISVSAGSPEGAQALADAVVARLGVAVEQLSEGEGGSLRVTSQTVQQAAVPSAPYSPAPLRDGLLGLFVGLSIGLGLVFVREFFNNKVSDEESLSRVAEIPVLGQLPWSRRRGGAASLLKDRGLADAVQRTAANYEFVNHSGDVRAVVLTSAQPGEGKSSVAMTLAVTLAASQRVLLVDADLRKPILADRLGLESSIGLTTIITGRATLAEAVQHVGRNRNLAVLTSGAIPPNPMQLIGSESFARFVADARQTYDVVLFDAPPLLPVADAALLGRVTDGAVLVVASRRSTTKQIGKALRQFALADVPVHGAIITMLKGKSARMAYYGQRGSKNAAGAVGAPDGAAPPRREAPSKVSSAIR